jgi:hypothetical protein
MSKPALGARITVTGMLVPHDGRCSLRDEEGNCWTFEINRAVRERFGKRVLIEGEVIAPGTLKVLNIKT